jgi:hypothetical protein
VAEIAFCSFADIFLGSSTRVHWQRRCLVYRLLQEQSLRGGDRRRYLFLFFFWGIQILDLIIGLLAK